MILIIELIYLTIALVTTIIVWKKKNYKKSFLILFLFTAPLWDVVPGYIYFKTLCVTDAGKVIYQKPGMKKDILMDGVWLSNYGCGSSCIKGLHEKTFDSIEMNVRKPSLEYLTTEPAIYKFYLARKGDKYCDVFDQYLDKYGAKYEKTIKGVNADNVNCIASKKIPVSMAYYTATDQYVSQFSKYLHISQHVTEILEKDRNKVIAKSISYIYRGGWLETILGAKGNPRYCPSENNVQNHMMHINLMLDVFSSNKGDEQRENGVREQLFLI
jgi:hypothetical protein